jgi:hypothetical protein
MKSSPNAHENMFSLSFKGDRRVVDTSENAGWFWLLCQSSLPLSS